MSDQKLNRREFFARAAVIGAAVTGASTILAACQNEKGKDGGGGAGKPEPKAKKVDCTDVSGLDDKQKNLRKSLQYVDKSTKPEQTCDNCKLFEKKDPCNGCKVVPGPIAAKGWCASWAPMS